MAYQYLKPSHPIKYSQNDACKHSGGFCLCLYLAKLHTPLQTKNKNGLSSTSLLYALVIYQMPFIRSFALFHLRALNFVKGRIIVIGIMIGTKILMVRDNEIMFDHDVMQRLMQEATQPCHH